MSCDGDDESSRAGGEVPLDDSDELLYRQVHPSWVQDGVPTSQAFGPTKKDEGKLSVDRGSLTTAKDSFRHHTGTLGLKSEGTWAIAVGEATGLTSSPA